MQLTVKRLVQVAIKLRNYLSLRINPNKCLTNTQTAQIPRNFDSPYECCNLKNAFAEHVFGSIANIARISIEC